MDISIFGLGYVGCVSTGCLAASNHTCIGVDVQQSKIDLINAGKPTIIEKDIDTLIREGHDAGRIRATTDTAEAIAHSEVSFICVGTPNNRNGHLNLDYVLTVARQIGEALRSKQSFHTIAIRSTVPPGTNDRVTRIIEDSSGKQANQHFAVVSNPEFMREGSAVQDYLHPELIIVGTSSDTARTTMKHLYEPIDAPVEIVAIKAAEIIKYVNNSYHALKIVFANEIGNICKSLDIDSHEVMRLFCMDKKLNISDKYFMPGFSYGGSCLPKDLKGLLALAHDSYLESPVLESIDRSNSYHRDRVLQLIIDQQKPRVGFMGLSFKAGTDDLRNSQTVELVERLLGKGFEIKIYDRNVVLSRLTGTNKAEIERKIPFINRFILEDSTQVIDSSDVVVFSYSDDGFGELVKQFPEKTFIDLVRIDNILQSNGSYYGLSW